MAKQAQKVVKNKGTGKEIQDPTRMREELIGYSEKYSLPALAMILSSRLVHEYRLKNAKSFGKFEAGDWEKVNIPDLDPVEIANLEGNYRKICDLFSEFFEIFSNKIEIDQAASARTKKKVSLGVLLENSLFKAIDTPLLSTFPAIDQKKLAQIRDILAQSDVIITSAYARVSNA
jgi:hypothetical protein